MNTKTITKVCYQLAALLIIYQMLPSDIISATKEKWSSVEEIIKNKKTKQIKWNH